MDSTTVPARSRILVVEDDELLRRVIARNLEARGFDVDEARTVEEAREQSARVEPSLVFLDIDLPDGTGWEFLETLRARGCHPGVVVVSAVHTRPERIAEFRPVAVLHKPFPLESLLRLAAECAGMSASSPSLLATAGHEERGTFGASEDLLSDVQR